jgi:hypothetical protein
MDATTSPPRADQISDFATFQTSSPTARLPSVSHVPSQQQFFDGNEQENFSEFGYSSPPPIEIRDEAEELYASSTPASEDEGDDYLHDNPADHSSSSRSSISSLPASVMPGSELDSHATIPRKQTITRDSFEHRVRSSPFRHTSSVRAMQMNDELTPPSKRRAISNMSQLTDASPTGSPSPSPSKRAIGTPKESAVKPGFKKEFPLILLHCKLLPPSLALPVGLKPTDERLLKDLLPEEYFSEWKLLQDRLGGASSTVKERGILISHPREDYDLLEERLLESLELIEPRIKDGHFLGCHHSEDDESNDETDAFGDEGEMCPDCGKSLQHTKENRKWEVKVYAATGLMREGAWGAAWKEMEKVDVEIGVFLPEKVKREIDQKFSDLTFDVMEDSFVSNESEEQRRRRREVYGDMPGHESDQPSQTSINGGQPEEPVNEKESKENREDAKPPAETPYTVHSNAVNPKFETDFQEVLWNYFKLLARDPRNFFITMLGVLCLYLTFTIPSTIPSAIPSTIPSTTTTQPEIMDTPRAPVFAMTECVVPSVVTHTQISVSTKTEFVMATVAPAEVNRDGEGSTVVEQL